MVKNLPAIQETQVQSLGQEYPLEKGKAIHSSILAWRILQRSLVGYGPWGHTESDVTKHAWTHMHINEIHKVLIFFHLTYFT